jgi:hypothetical protein
LAIVLHALAKQREHRVASVEHPITALLPYATASSAALGLRAVTSKLPDRRPRWPAWPLGCGVQIAFLVARWLNTARQQAQRLADLNLAERQVIPAPVGRHAVENVGATEARTIGCESA